jgi:hypothetical protein
VREEQKLRDNEIGCVRVDVFTEENNTIGEKARVNIVGAFTTIGFFDDSRNEVIVWINEFFGHDFLSIIRS